MMTATTWMDANSAKEYGFIDDVVTAPADGITNAAFSHTVDRAEAKKKVDEWENRHKPGAHVADMTATPIAADPVVTEPEHHEAKATDASAPAAFSVSADQLHKRLDLLKPHDIY